jgi:hypothetical protein
MAVQNKPVPAPVKARDDVELGTDADGVDGVAGAGVGELADARLGEAACVGAVVGDGDDDGADVGVEDGTGADVGVDVGVGAATVTFATANPCKPLPLTWPGAVSPM